MKCKGDLFYCNMLIFLMWAENGEVIMVRIRSTGG